MILRRTPANLLVRASSSTLNSGGQLIAVKRICQHPAFDFWTINSDVSVLTLEEDVELGEGAQPVQLIKAGEELEVGTEAVVTGWGTTSEGGGLPKKLQAVRVPRVSDGRCKELYSEDEITSTMICFGVEKGGKDSCQVKGHGYFD